LKKRHLLFGIIVLLCIVGILYFAIPIIAHKWIVSESMDFQPETLISFDNKYVLHQLKYDEPTGTFASFAIDSRDTGERLFLCHEKYRTLDLKSISWEDGSYTVTVISGDVGTIYYCRVEGIWVKSDKTETNDSYN